MRGTAAQPLRPTRTKFVASESGFVWRPGWNFPYVSTPATPDSSWRLSGVRAGSGSDQSGNGRGAPMEVGRIPAEYTVE